MGNVNNILIIFCLFLTCCCNFQRKESKVGGEKVYASKPDSLPEKKCIDSSKIQPDGMCIQIYQPVCGCDGKTYSNSCMASIKGVTEWVEGECNKKN